jgi:SET domain-containing protein
VLCNDDDRYINHSEIPNVIPVAQGPGTEPYWIAARDIHEGEELTCDYRHFDEEITFEIRRVDSTKQRARSVAK